MILAPAGVFWLACLGQFVGTLSAFLVIALLWHGVDAAGRAANRRRKARREVQLHPPAQPAEPERPPGRHHAAAPLDPSATAPHIPRIGPPTVSGAAPWGPAVPSWDGTGTRTRPTLKNREDPPK